ncbi:hypothetical protein F6O57_09660 [Streptococcus suis]|nr:hypothetical protein [Streptococcus suis]MBS7925297.1 hypothetical protein [Streptococcus suis]
MLPKSLNTSLFGFCELSYCVHNNLKSNRQLNPNLTGWSADDKKTWWLRPQTPKKKSRVDFLKLDRV